MGLQVIKMWTLKDILNTLVVASSEQENNDALWFRGIVMFEQLSNVEIYKRTQMSRKQLILLMSNRCHLKCITVSLIDPHSQTINEKPLLSFEVVRNRMVN